MMYKHTFSVKRLLASTLLLVVPLAVPVLVSADGLATDYDAVPPVISTAGAGDKPNIMVVLDNSNSMDEAPDGHGVGSASSASKSEIARVAIKGIIDTFADNMRMGLMAYQQSGVGLSNLHDSQYDVSFDPANYDSTYGGDRDSLIKAKRVPNPTDAGSYLYYNIALPFYTGTNDGNAFCYSATADFDNGSETVAGPWDSYRCYRIKTGTSDSGTTDMSTHFANYTFSPTDSDFAQNILDFGKYLTWQYVGPTWFANTSPGGGQLHVPIAAVDAAQKTLLQNKLATSQFAVATDTPLRNAGLTPIEGTLKTAQTYFSTYTSGNTCTLEDDYVVMVTDGLPSTSAAGATLADPDAAIAAAATAAANLLTAGVKTYVIGFALPTGVDPTVLDAIAIAGGTGQAYPADDAAALNSALGKIFLNIINRASSGTGAAVLANNSRGDGAFYQALYVPQKIDDSGNKVSWVGVLNGLFIDQYGLLREDTNGNDQVDNYGTDKIVEYFYDEVEQRTRVYYKSSTSADVPTDLSVTAIAELDDLHYIWSARDQLAAITDPLTQRSYTTSAANGRAIYTSTDGSHLLNFIGLTEAEQAALHADEATTAAAVTTAESAKTTAEEAKEATYETMTAAEIAATAANEALADPEANYLAATTAKTEAETAATDARTAKTNAETDATAAQSAEEAAYAAAYNAEYTLAYEYYIGAGNSAEDAASLAAAIAAPTASTDPTYQAAFAASAEADTVLANATTASTLADAAEAAAVSAWNEANATYASARATADTANTTYASAVSAYEAAAADYTAAVTAYNDAVAAHALATDRVLSIRYFAYMDLSGTEANKTVRWVRGEKDIAGYRSRELDWTGDGTTETWRLGDIINSTPVVVSTPRDRYDLINSDATYAAFVDKYYHRRHMIYVGANDGMLHAFNAGFWNDEDRAYDTDNSFVTGATAVTAHPLGTELWAYVPKAVLPHLQWLTAPGYSHSYYVDGEPVVFDAQIFTADTDHPNGWGTVLVVPMRLGGGEFSVDTDGDGTVDEVLRSSISIFDVTNPEVAPKLLAEFSHEDLGFTTSKPALLKARIQASTGGFSSPSSNRWLLAFGSGPNVLDSAVSDQTAKLFLFDLETLSAVSGFAPLDLTDANSYVGDIGVVDWNSDYVDDALYFGVNSGLDQPDATLSATTETGRIARVRLDSNDTETFNETNWLANRVLGTLLNPGRTMLGAPLGVRDNKGRLWVYGGTGRLLVAADNYSDKQQRYYGVMEPIDASTGAEAGTTADVTNLEDVTNIRVFLNSGEVDRSGSTFQIPSGTDINNFTQLENAISKEKSGWYHELDYSGANSPSGRNINGSARFRSLIFYSEYTPSNLACYPEGTSELHAVHYKTGTATPFDVIGTDPSILKNSEELVLSGLELGRGLASEPTIITNNAGDGSNSAGTLAIQLGTGELKLINFGEGGSRGGRESWREIEMDGLDL